MSQHAIFANGVTIRRKLTSDTGLLLHSLSRVDNRLVRDRSLITSRGGGGTMVLEGGYNFKTSSFFGGKFFTDKKHEWGQIL